MQHAVTPTQETWDGLLLTFLSEFGDKSFFAVITLTLWCPVSGLRYHAFDHHSQLFGVFAGGIAGLLGRLLLVRLRLSKPLLGLRFLDSFLSMLLLFYSAYVFKGLTEDLNHAEEKERQALRDQERRRLSMASGTSGAVQAGPPPPSGNPFLGEFRAYQPPDKMPEQEGYGGDLGRLPSRGADDESWSLSALAFLITMTIVFVLEANDRSYILMQTVLIDAGSYVIYGVVLGLLLSMVVAVMLGYIADACLSDSRKLFVISCAIVALCFSMLSDAILLVLHNTYKPNLQPVTSTARSENPRPVALLEVMPESSLRVGRKVLSRFMSAGALDPKVLTPS